MLNLDLSETIFFEVNVQWKRGISMVVQSEPILGVHHIVFKRLGFVFVLKKI